MSLLFLCLIPSLQSQDSLQIKRLSIAEGLSQSTIFAMAQDQRGFLWFGTQPGLNRYDGYQFKVYLQNRDIPNSLSSGLISSLLADRSGNLWVGTDNGLNRYIPEKDNFKTYFHDPKTPDSLSSNQISALHEDRSGNIWIGTDGGLNRLDPASGRFSRYHMNLNDPTSLSHDYVRAILQDHEGYIWAGTDGGLNRLNPQTGKFDRFHHSRENPGTLCNDEVLALCEDQQGNLWIGTRNGLDRMALNSMKIDHFLGEETRNIALTNRIIQCIYMDQSGTIWIGTNADGVVQYLPEKDQIIVHRNDPNDPASLSGNRIMSILEDRSGSIWFGSYSAGLSRFNKSVTRFRLYKQERNNPNSLSSNLIRQIYKDQEGILWVATDGAGLNRIDRKKGENTVYRCTPNDPTTISYDQVLSIFPDRDGTMWIGTGDGLNQFDPKKGQFRRYLHQPGNSQSPSHYYVRTICEDRQGFLWLGTNEDGLIRFDKKTGLFKQFLPGTGGGNSLSYHRVFSLLVDKAGILWIGTYGGGLNRFDTQTETFTLFRYDPRVPNGIQDNYILSLLEDSRGILWIGTAFGLARFDRSAGTFRHYAEKDGLPDRVIYAIVEDNRGDLWCSTNRGIFRFHPADETVRSFDIHDGLQSYEFNTYSYFKASDGELFFGGINGFNSFYPDEIEKNQSIPPIVITDFKIFNRDVPIGLPVNGRIILKRSIENSNRITLAYWQNVFSLEFAALHFIAPEKNQYAYMMEGLDTDWIQAGNRRFVSYAGIPPGNYRFRVKGSNCDDFWNEKGISLDIIVVPPFWKTRWFMVLCLISGISLIALLYFQRIRSLTKKKQELENLVTLRTQELKEISLKDPLTGLRNRRFIREVLTCDLDAFLKKKCYIMEKKPNRRNITDSQVYGILMVDIDHFKTINDQYGHDMGDKFLLEFSRIMKSTIRADDEVIRYGGEEFLVILKNTHPDFLSAFTTKLKDELDRIDRSLHNPEMRRTCSIGFTRFPFYETAPRLLSFDEIVLMVDLALYFAKKNGRDMAVQILPGNRTPEKEQALLLIQSLDFGIENDFIHLISSR